MHSNFWTAVRIRRKIGVELDPYANRLADLFDDIRVWNMLAIWRGIRRPKLDLTSFGHWSGTGLVDY